MRPRETGETERERKREGDAGLRQRKRDSVETGGDSRGSRERKGETQRKRLKMGKRSIEKEEGGTGRKRQW
jgi:hypothetical protein